MIINSNNINNFKEKEEMYLQKIYELESYNKHLNSLISYSINSNSNKKENNLYNYFNTNNNEYENEIHQNNIIYKKNESQKNTKKNYRIKTNKSVENLINEREMLIKNANYTDNDPIIIHLNNKIDKYKNYM